MCGIIGIFNHPEAELQVKTALALLENRGKDGSNYIKINENSLLGHTLHAVVNKVLQPIKQEGILAANCEIYNWLELNENYNFKAKNDAELLLKFLDQFDIDKISKIDELEGVFAFAYYKDNKVILVRDLLGEKPIWFSDDNQSLAFASEKKVLIKLNYTRVRELNPRQILIYDVKDKTIETKAREFLTYSPEHSDNYEQIKDKTKQLLIQAIKKRIPDKKFGLLFSGGIDSTFLAKSLQNLGCDFTCYTAVLNINKEKPSGKEPSDLVYAKKAAKELNLKLKIKKVKLEEIPTYLQKIVPLIEDSNVVKVGVALPFYLACEMAREDGCKVIFSGLGSEEIFAGYERHKHSQNINQECASGLLKIYERDLYRDDVITMDNSLELRLPFLDLSLVKYALRIPERYKIKDEITKLILREIALESGIPREFAFRKKIAAQYGSRFDYALGKLAKQNKYLSKSDYLRQFYQNPNLRLGVLFSSGKDSTSAAYIMKKQNYEIACLINLKSRNPDSYMFQSAGNELVELQAQAMGIPLVVQETAGEKEQELVDLEKALIKAKERYQIEGIVSGALFSNYQRSRIEKICDKLGLKIFAPLWHKPQETHLMEVVKNGFEAIITAVAAEGLDQSWLGKKIDLNLLKQLKSKKSINYAGEGGEYESLVLNCPLFNKKIEIIKSKSVMNTPYSGRLIIEEARLMEKSTAVVNKDINK